MKKFLKGNEAYAAEFIGTFFLVLCGTGAIAAGSRFPGMGNALGGPLAFGLTIMVMVYTFGGVSGAHFNPAVSLGLYSIGKLKLQDLKIYLGCQFAAAVLASIVLKILVSPSNLGVTNPSLPAWQAWGIEVFITFMLVTVILGVTNEASSLGKAAVGLAIGGAIVAAAIWAGPLSDASMNPARSFGPALVSGDFRHLWIYLTAPLAGGWLAAQAHVLVHPQSK